MLDEPRIKAAVIDRLLSTGALDDAVLINEMVYANWTRRADLAVANGHLQAFEIKSDFDSLRRLDGQISVYLERFDKLTLVVTPRFVDAVLASAPVQVAVWCISEEKSDVVIRVVRAGRKVAIENREVLISYLLRDELYQFLSAQNIPVRRAHSRSHLVAIAKTQSRIRLRFYVLEALKARYQKSYCAFIASRQETTVPNDLLALRKARESDSARQADNVIKMKPDSKKVYLSLSRLFPHGEIPVELSGSLVVRNRVVKRRKIHSTT